MLLAIGSDNSEQRDKTILDQQILFAIFAKNSNC